MRIYLASIGSTEKLYMKIQVNLKFIKEEMSKVWLMFQQLSQNKTIVEK